MPGTRTHLDNPALAGRLKTAQSRRSTYERRAVVPGPRVINDFGIGLRAKPVVKVVAVSHAAVARTAPKPTPSRQARSAVLMRRVVASQTKVRSKGRKPRMNIRAVALSSLAVILFVFGVGVGVLQLNTNKEVKAQVKTLAAHTEQSGDGALPDGGLPSEERPTGGGYRAAPDAPKTILIPDLDVKARVLSMGVKANNEVKTPSNIYDAGWFEGSAKPGELGAVFINGHVHGPTIPGVFVGLKKMQAGDKIKIERGDGKVFTYSVVKTQTYDKGNVDMGAAFNSAVPGKPGLNLMTCVGSYTTTGGYDKRLMVFAVQD